MGHSHLSLKLVFFIFIPHIVVFDCIILVLLHITHASPNLCIHSIPLSLYLTEPKIIRVTMWPQRVGEVKTLQESHDSPE